MRLEVYQENTKRTLPQLGGLVNDSIHMTVGMMTELTELLTALNKRKLDHVNIKEEIGDYMWYLSNYANIHNFTLLSTKYTQQYSESFFTKILVKLNLRKSLSRKVFEELMIFTGDLLDLDKKKFAYKRNYDIAAQSKLFIICCNTIFMYCELNGYKIEQIVETNINKLIARYPEKFSETDANNRNLEVERKILENE